VNLFYQPGIPEGLLFLDQEESRHCVKVLRHKTGDSIRITDGKGYFYTGIIQTADQRQCEFLISEKIAEPVRDFSIHIAISPTKNTERLSGLWKRQLSLGLTVSHRLIADIPKEHF
jgi:16S rRNA (uracil1498-N3)-methyltransferase